MEAYDAYLVGRAFVNARTPVGRQCCCGSEKAIRLDENYAPPYAGLAVALTLGGNADRVAARESAVPSGTNRYRVGPDLAEGHAALGLILLDDTENEIRTRRTVVAAGLELDPSLSIAYSGLSRLL